MKFSATNAIRIVGVCSLTLLFAFLQQPSRAQAQKSGGEKARTVARPTCRTGARLSLSAQSVLQGSVVLATLTTPNPITEARATWDRREFAFWPKSPASGPAKVWQALLGVDLEKPPGVYDLRVNAVSPGAPDSECTGWLRVRKGIFPTENLKVENQFVEPDPEQARRAKAEGEKWAAIVATVTPERLWTGPFRLPLDGVTTGGNFGRRRVLNGQPRSPHTGVDFPALTGTPVHAAQGGRVVLAEPLFFAGNTVIVDHGLGLYTFYLHLSAFAVKAGDPVEKGTVLGQVGATGRVTGPHLHWGVTLDRERVNGIDLVRVLRSPRK